MLTVTELHPYDITGPRVSAYPNYGFVAKVQNPKDGNWHTNCFEPGDPANGVKVSYSYGHDSAAWATVDGEWNSGNSNFFPLFYLAACRRENEQTRFKLYFADSTELPWPDLGLK